MKLKSLLITFSFTFISSQIVCAANESDNVTMSNNRIESCQTSSLLTLQAIKQDADNLIAFTDHLIQGHSESIADDNYSGRSMYLQGLVSAYTGSKEQLAQFAGYVQRQIDDINHQNYTPSANLQEANEIFQSCQASFFEKLQAIKQQADTLIANADQSIQAHNDSISDNYSYRTLYLKGLVSGYTSAKSDLESFVGDVQAHTDDSN